MGSHHVAAVDGFGQLLAEMLTTAAHVKEKTTTVDQPLNKSDLGGLFSKIDTVFTSTSSPEVKKRAQYAIIETAVFEVFSDLLSGIFLTLYQFSPIMNNVIRRFCFGSLKSFWIAKRSLVVERSLTISSQGGKE
ncbi:hypothetical protein DH86_00002323 [Scytalidium sp. 3C]|nr:hypothetical protein DH86_00002323 [Scytalidium sp. 3C]